MRFRGSITVSFYAGDAASCCVPNCLTKITWTGLVGPSRREEHPPRSGRRLGLSQAFPMGDVFGLGVLALGLLLGDRRETGQFVEVGDDVGEHPEHSGDGRTRRTRCRDRFRGEGSSRPSPRALVAPGHSWNRPRRTYQSRPQGDLGGRRGPGQGPPLDPPLTEPPEDLAGLFRAQKLVDSTRAEPLGGRDLTAPRRLVTAGHRRRPRSAPIGLRRAAQS